jgi:hypothetical protein
MWRSLCMMIILLMAGCGEESPHPNQQAIDRAEKHTDESIQQLEQARQEAKDLQRLRDLDKMTFDSRVNEIEAATSIWKGWMLSLAVLLVSALLWLAREVRLRRVLSYVLVSIRRDYLKGGD